MSQPRAAWGTPNPDPVGSSVLESSLESRRWIGSEHSWNRVVVTALEDEHCLRAVRAFQAGEAIVDLDGTITPARNRMTIEIGLNCHLDPKGFVWGYANHACDPNAWVDLGACCLRALKPIPAGHEITWNYLCTEWELSNPFQCRCGSPVCHGAIRGLRFVAPERIAAFAGQITRVLRSRLDPTSQGAIP